LNDKKNQIPLKSTSTKKVPKVFEESKKTENYKNKNTIREKDLVQVLKLAMWTAALRRAEVSAFVPLRGPWPGANCPLPNCIYSSSSSIFRLCTMDYGPSGAAAMFHFSLAPPSVPGAAKLAARFP
jgi:hypothetical protein